MLDNYGYRHTLIIVNTYCFFTMVTRTRLSVTFIRTLHAWRHHQILRNFGKWWKTNSLRHTEDMNYLYIPGVIRAQLVIRSLAGSLGKSRELVKNFFSPYFLTSYFSPTRYSRLVSVTYEAFSFTRPFKCRSRSASCSCKLPIIFKRNLCEPHQWRARAALWSPLV